MADGGGLFTIRRCYVPKHSKVMLLFDQDALGTFSGQVCELEPKKDPKGCPRLDISPTTQAP